jgi:DNA topoisomerase I
MSRPSTRPTHGDIPVTRTRRVSPNRPGWTRRRQGRGFVYLDEHGGQLTGDDLARCKALGIPPAWRDVWICPVPNGHLQALGTDDAGRRQYLYHPAWREQRDRAKFDRVLEFAQRLPKARRLAAEDLRLPGMPRDRALATGFRLLDLGLFRIGGEEYAEENESYGLATIEKRHVRINDGALVFEYRAKSGQERLVAVTDDDVRAAVAELRRRRGGGKELLAYRDGRRWHDVSSGDINGYVKTLVGPETSAKDFRTWHGTVMASVSLAEVAEQSGTSTARTRAVKKAMAQVAEYLGNTPRVARGSYVDPRVVDRFEEGVTIAATLRRTTGAIELDEQRERLERAVIRLLRA